MTPFSQRVSTPEWRAEVETWISERLAHAALTATGPIEQPRVRPWSTQLVVPTDGGTVWFKANCAAQASTVNSFTMKPPLFIWPGPL